MSYVAPNRDPVFRESILIDAIAANHALQRASREQAMLLRIAHLTGRSASDIEACDRNDPFTVAEFLRLFQPDRNTFFKGRLNNKSRLGMKARLDLTDDMIEQALSNPEKSTGFYSTNAQFHVSIQVALLQQAAWLDRYFPTSGLQRACRKVRTGVFGFPPSLAFRTNDGAVLTWFLSLPVDSQQLIDLLTPKIEALHAQFPRARFQLIGTHRKQAFIRHRRDMVDGHHLKPLLYSAQMAKHDIRPMLAAIPTVTQKDRKRRPTMKGVEPSTRSRYRKMRNAMVTHFSSRRLRAVVRLFNFVWCSNDDVRAGRIYLPRWLAKKYGPCVSLHSATMKLVDDSYRSTLRTWENLSILLPISKYSRGNGCYDPHASFFFLDINANVAAHRGPASLTLLSKQYDDRKIATLAGVTPRTIQNWKRDPQTIPRHKADALIAAHQISCAGEP